MPSLAERKSDRRKASRMTLDRMINTTARRLREIAEAAISINIYLRRYSRELNDIEYEFVAGPPSEDEVNDFLASNPNLAAETIEQLLDPGFLGFDAKRVKISRTWLLKFKEDL